jgi:hypothetical protein
MTMKRTLFYVLLTIYCPQILSQGFDQIQKGNYLAGGTLSGFYEQREILDFNYQYELDINPTIGYFIINRLLVGITPSTSVIWSKSYIKGPYNKEYFFELSPLVRYYFWKRMFISFEPGYIIGNFKSTNYDSNTKGYSFNQGIGYDFFLKEDIAIEIGYYYYHSKQTIDEKYETLSPLGIDLITNKFKINIGIQIIL